MPRLTPHGLLLVASLMATVPTVAVAKDAARPAPAARRAAGDAKDTVPGSPTLLDRKEWQPQPKEGDRVRPPSRRVVPAVLPPRRQLKVSKTKEPPLSLEKAPADLPPLIIDRERFFWLASPRLKSGVYATVHSLGYQAKRFRRYDPELVYEKQDNYITAAVGGSLRAGPLELGFTFPVVSVTNVEFFQKGLVDAEAQRVERAPMVFTAKLGWALERGDHRILLTPFVNVGLPTGSRIRYGIRLGGRPLSHETAGPRGLAVLPGMSAGWRWGMLSAVASVGVVARVVVPDAFLPKEQEWDLQVGWLAAYQLAVTPFRDLAVCLTFQHFHELKGRTGEDGEDLVFLTPALRFYPYKGLIGLIGVSFPITAPTWRDAPVTLILHAGWEFR